MADPADQREVVTFEAHPRAAPVAEPAASELIGDVAGGHPQPRGQALDDHDECATV